MPEDFEATAAVTGNALSNADIAKRLLSLAQLLSTQKENPFKIRAYRRAAQAISNLPESVEDLVRGNADLTQYPGIGKAISSAIREIVESGGALQKLEKHREAVGPELAALSEYPRLDPRRVARIYKKLRIGSVPELRDRLERGDVREQFGDRMDQHVRQALTDSREILLYHAHPLVRALEAFLLERCGVKRADVAGDYRRLVEIVGELTFVIDTGDFQNATSKLQRYGGGTKLLQITEATALFELPSGIHVRIEHARPANWGVSLILATGTKAHIRKLEGKGPPVRELLHARASYRTEAAVYRALGLRLVPPELREGRDEVELAAADRLPELIETQDIRGEFHAHTTSSDGRHTIEQMAEAARERGYEYLGITDHSQSLTIARGLSESDLWRQIRSIDALNENRDLGIRLLKSAEVDILADGALDYPDALLKELDYTICSIHSRFGLGRTAQTERLMRAMDNRYCNILGHATGRLLLKRPGYDVDVERLVEHATASGCFFEINSSPDRLDLSAENARLVRHAGLKIALNTDAHSTREFAFSPASEHNRILVTCETILTLLLRTARISLIQLLL